MQINCLKNLNPAKQNGGKSRSYSEAVNLEEIGEIERKPVYHKK